MGSMASSITANRSNHNDNDDAYDRAKSLYLMEVHEKGGSVLKDYYTRDEYRHRRGRFLSKLAEHPKPSVDHWANSKVDADLIFGTGDDQLQLDVQQVRDLELEMEFDVLLPLPTTVNTQTIDNFKTCPPADGSREADEEDEEVVEDGRDVPTPGGSFTHSTPGTSPAEGVATYDKYASLQLSNPAQFTNTSRVPDLPFANFPDHQPLFKPVEATSEPPVSLFTIGQTPPVANKAIKLNLSKPARQGPDEAIPTAVKVQRPTVTSTTPPAPKTFVPHPDVSSMAHYGMPSPVKGAKRQHISDAVMIEESNQIRPNAPVAKMTASKPKSNLNISTTVDDIDHSTGPIASMEPPSKKLKDAAGVARPVETPVVATPTVPTQDNTSANTFPNLTPVTTNPLPESAPVTINPLPNSTPVTTNHVANPAPIVTTTPNVAAAVQASTPLPRLNDIITGKILPRTKLEATEGANELHNRLLADHRSQGQGQSNNRKSARQSTTNVNNINQDPDFMPHYFSPANFTEHEQEVGVVRCVCGVTWDDKKPMTCCGKCEVWQHSTCVASHLIGQTEAELEKVDFRCTVCDPYAHRHVLQKVRSGKLADKQNGKGQAKAKEAPKGKAGTVVAAKGKGRGKGKK
jgi:hypothetical protein